MLEWRTDEWEKPMVKPLASGTDATIANAPAKPPEAASKTRAEAEAVVAKLEAGAKENAQAFRDRQKEIARNRLGVLKLEAILSARMKDAKSAKRVAAEAAKVARDLKSLRAEDAAEATAKAPVQTAQDLTSDKPSDEIAGLIQEARKIMAIARKAVRPGSVEDRELAGLQNATGTADPRIDAVSDADLMLSKNGPNRFDVRA